MLEELIRASDLFLENKYTRWYIDLIINARQDPTIYGEYHHIIPRCLGGTDEKPNLVFLSAREHYIAHLLLPKMVKTAKHRQKTVAAFKYLSYTKNKHTSDRYSSRLFEYHKKISYSLHCHSGELNPRYGQICSNETKEKISRSKRGRSAQYTDEQRKLMSERCSTRNSDPDFIKKVSLAQRRRYRIVYDDGSEEIVHGLKEWAQQNGYNENHLISTIDNPPKYRRKYNFRVYRLDAKKSG